jgi:ABC-type dipeptide/oligopeptide/nickel transport system ATPase subunit
MLYNWADSNRAIEKISQLTNEEIIARSSDSKWRSFDLYIITFGRCLPVAILILISMVLKNDITSPLLLTLWLSVPFIGLIMEAGRFTTDYRLGKKAYDELQLASKQDRTINPNLVLDDNWEIWDGSLAENCLITTDNHTLNLIDKLRLSEEFNLDANDVELSRFGNNISEGQKTRILLTRAIHLALSTQRTLLIERTLNSLDPDACRRLKAILKDPVFLDKITLTKNCETFIENQLLRESSARHTGENYRANIGSVPGSSKVEGFSDGLLKDFTKFFNPLSAAFILPAISLSLVGYIAIANYSLVTKLLSILTLSILSVALVVFLGIRNETFTRHWGKNQLIDILLHAKLKNSVDIFQRLSRDFNTLVERISWYVHDITWLLALVIVSICASVISFGSLGLLISGLFVLFSFGIWKIFEKKINIARKASVDTLNQTLTMGENLVCFGRVIENSFIRNKRKTLIEQNINNLYQSNVNVISLKLIFSNLILCVSGFFILATVVGSTYQWIGAGSLVFILTAILAVDASLGILFQALSGFSAQRISIHRLTNFEKENMTIQPYLVKNKDSYSFTGAHNRITGLKYSPINFEAGCSYSVLGRSGIGKTQFLKLISGINDISQPTEINNSGSSILYIDQNFNAIESWMQDMRPEEKRLDNLVEFVEHKMTNEKFNIIILDEALIIYDVEKAKQIILVFQNLIQQFNGLMLFVDHRFTLMKSISISEVQSSIDII